MIRARHRSPGLRIGNHPCVRAPFIEQQAGNLMAGATVAGPPHDPVPKLQ
jgi:hypothetical protein